jgi:hypothetical protein
MTPCWKLTFILFSFLHLTSITLNFYMVTSQMCRLEMIFLSYHTEKKDSIIADKSSQKEIVAEIVSVFPSKMMKHWKLTFVLFLIRHLTSIILREKIIEDKSAQKEIVTEILELFLSFWNDSLLKINFHSISRHAQKEIVTEILSFFLSF